jgi:predicted DNA-binding WGR domain protein
MAHQISKNCLNSNTTLFREVDHKLRYYSLKLYPTLFQEVILERSFGSVKNKKPTRVIKEYFSHIEDAMCKYSEILKQKINKGYLHI